MRFFDLSYCGICSENARPEDRLPGSKHWPCLPLRIYPSQENVTWCQLGAKNVYLWYLRKQTIKNTNPKKIPMFEFRISPGRAIRPCAELVG